MLRLNEEFYLFCYESEVGVYGGCTRQFVVKQLNCCRVDSAAESVMLYFKYIGPGSFDVEDATTLSWSSAAVSE